MNNERDLWYLEEEDEVGDNLSVAEYDISSVPNDFNTSTLYNFMESGIVKIPEFQRNYVWDQKRASKLIESLLLGLPVPQIFLYEEAKNSYLIIDGQQRLMSIYFFIKQRFPKMDSRNIIRRVFEDNNLIPDSILFDDRYFVDFVLKLEGDVSGNKSQYNGLKYATLPPGVKATFDHMRTIRSIVVKQNLPDDDSSMFEIFNRLNTGGQNLTTQEIRSSIFVSKFYNMLSRINQDPLWRVIIGKDEPDVHCKDIEIILRGFALLCDYQSYKPSMTKFLNSFSKKARNFSPDKINYMENLFKSFLRSCKCLTSDDFATIKGKFNISLFDAVFVAVCRPYFEKMNIINKTVDKISLEKLKKDVTFIKVTQSTTASKNSVSTRIKKAQEILKLE